MEDGYKPTIPMLPQRKGQAAIRFIFSVDSVIINAQQAAWITQKIVELTKPNQENQRTPRMNNNFYKLTLLYRHSRDGNKFREICAEKGPTVAVGKVLDTEEILGGYNPMAWKAFTELDPSSPDVIWVSTSESFIFSLDKDNAEKNIVSPVVNNNGAIVEHEICYPYFGSGDLFFGNTGVNPHARKCSYKTAIRSDSSKFKWADWEVFSVSM